MRLPIGSPLIIRYVKIPELAGIRGLLGLSFLKHFTTILDYRQGYMEIS